MSEKLESLVEHLNFVYPDSGWTIVIRGGMTNDDGDFVMDAVIYTSWPHIARSDRNLAAAPEVAECINLNQISDVIDELYNDLTNMDGFADAMKF